MIHFFSPVIGSANSLPPKDQEAHDQVAIYLNTHFKKTEDLGGLAAQTSQAQSRKDEVQAQVRAMNAVFQQQSHRPT